MEKIDVVIVGAGLSGLSAAYYLAEAGLQVIVLERGDLPGSKNVTGGRLYLGPIRKIVPELLDGAPLERPVTSERLTIMSERASTTLSFHSQAFKDPILQSYTVLRAKLDRWLGDKVMGKGGFVIPQKKVDTLLKEGERVVGIRSDGEEIHCDVVVIAEGVVSILCEQMALRRRLPPQHSATAVKEVIELPPGSLERRLALPAGEGTAHLFIGAVTKGTFGGGFLYTNENTVSLGIVVGMKSLLEVSEELETHRLIEAFKGRPEVSPYIADGKTVEYAAHLIPEGGYEGLIKPYGDGYLVVGDAAGLALNMGLTVRGMDMALASGCLAAKTILKAKETGDFSQQALSYYQRLLDESFIMKDLRAFQDAHQVISNARIYSVYPSWINGALEALYSFDEGPKEKLGKTLWRSLKAGPSVANLAKDLWSIRHI